MFHVYAVIGLEIPPYPTMMEDAALMLRLITAGQMCFYTLLFSVKMSLLTLYRKLLAGLPSLYQKIWWGIVAFCVLVRNPDTGRLFSMLILTQSWLGSAFSSIFTCDNLNEKFKKGKCGGTRNEDQRIIFSLYFAYAVDVATDIASKIIVLRLPSHSDINIS